MIDIGEKYFMVILDQVVEFEAERKEGGYYSVVKISYLKIDSLLLTHHTK